MLIDWTSGVLAHCGLARADARLAAQRLVQADAMGVGTHGVARLPVYAGQLREGTLNARAALETERESPGLLRLRAHRMLGQLAAMRGLALAADAVAAGQAIVTFTISEVGHLGALRTHVAPLAEAGLVAFLCQSTQPVMAGEGARGPAIGNNPFAFAAPRADGPPLLMDMAASRVARGHLLAARREGQALPPGWAIDAQGLPTTDPAAGLAGAVLPAAGHKGLAWAMLVQVLAGALTGSRPDRQASAAAGAGAYGFVIDPAGFAGRAAYDAGMAHWLDVYRAAYGAAARLPGEGSESALRRSATQGIPLSGALAGELAVLGRDLGFSFPHGA
ncbi:hypothetical protein AXA74_20865 [Bordetella hinzii LMG 13501]|nr:hypothetical protein AXA74_20865 [Bordetella hinzii LMG 13501]